MHAPGCDAHRRLVLLEPEGQRARTNLGARGDDRARDLRRPALPGAAVLVLQRRGRPLMPSPSAAGEGVAIDAQRLTSAVTDILAAAGIAAADAQVAATDLVA